MKCPTAWERDGALRDMYVFEASLGEWQRVLDFVRGPEMSRDEGLNWIAEQLGLDKADHEGVIQRLIDAANKPYTAHRPRDPEE